MLLGISFFIEEQIGLFSYHVLCFDLAYFLIVEVKPFLSSLRISSVMSEVLVSIMIDHSNEIIDQALVLVLVENLFVKGILIKNTLILKQLFNFHVVTLNRRTRSAVVC